MIVLTDFSTALDRHPSARNSLTALPPNASSGAVTGIIAARCGLKIDTSAQHEGFDLYRIVDELGKLSPFAVICTGDDQISDPQRTGIAIDHAIRELGFYDRSNVVIHSLPFDRLRPHLQFSDVSYVFLSSSQVISILVPEQKSGVRHEIKPRELLLQQILDATPLRLLNPYVFRGPV
ncbi:MAG TPA: hypothetical protein DCX79_12360, partial [Planctomycetaceae bacterium]|nr:hypothetical protein [Planctomycetaceae bacterium]